MPAWAAMPVCAMKAILLAVGVVLVGCTVGLLSGLVGARAISSLRPRPATLAASLEQAQSFPVQLHRQLSETQAKRAAPGQANALTAPATHGRKAESTGADPASGMARIKQRFDDKLASFAAEPTDVRWARFAEKVIGDGLGMTGRKAGFRAADLQCHSTMCVAYLEWDSYATMQSNLHFAYEESNNVNCGQWTLAPERREHAAKVTVPLVMECAEWKGQGSVPLSGGAQYGVGPRRAF